MIESRVKIRPLDCLAVALVTTMVVTCGFTIYRPGGGEPVALVETREGRRYFPLDQDAQIVVQGPLGSTVIGVHGGRVHIESSPCDNQTCVTMGWIGEEGGWVACLPNRVFVRVQKGMAEGLIRVKSAAEEGGTDARTW